MTGWGSKVDARRRPVGGWPVGARQRHVVQPQVDAELRAMVHDVVEEHLPVGKKTSPVEDALPAKKQLPVLLPGPVGQAGKCVAGFGCAFAEHSDELRG